MDAGTLIKRGSPFLDRTKVTVDQPARLFDDEANCRLPENCCWRDCNQKYDRGAPPQKNDGAI
mgnify:CR=1 FL=1